ncbi:acetyl-CoA carboxylase biotin carboxyl carrier protein [Heyndrickxia ginsengihumi]|uniref:Biotin carboxyl carrier protein of acetyl-CoA carboxylase n=1 Tax=Heyndrickxia ginsengihumi TaxID=363870 RepID=A0A0A6Y122_9BACI|nr:acetyl-CoA carboxylase biotin carboxyl carrier protein [Heyndrickxia ginsengihumi]KHD85987.1 acetyl-CoA carboxylase [Heyndrickxia ginsengihumi]MBE6182968.1 acetyl-CoA carboxylase biotin carboxyl carrier protein [Bacillus sp. (in: firmicutes)]MCM3022809.1 acetyl-CoA carboxylase biotin carboxyl carrier protein [Heyndrickxia ginsengihumi]NEY20076.1 acetyl-CoA carboxylase biotin carboxyl carrier protein [Heyndrickxia ginsengihumi]
MLKVQDIRELIELVDQSSINEFEYENEGVSIKLKKNTGVQIVERAAAEAPFVAAVQAPQVAQTQQPAQAAPQASEAEKAADENLHKIVSPMVGTFYQAPSPDKEAYVRVGSKVSSDSIVCMIEAMKLFNEIEAEVEGEIVEILVNNGQLVEYGQPLFLVKTK